MACVMVLVRVRERDLAVPAADRDASRITVRYVGCEGKLEFSALCFERALQHFRRGGAAALL